MEDEIDNLNFAEDEDNEEEIYDPTNPDANKPKKKTTDMKKNHYISFIAAQSSDRIQMVKLYPEGNAEARFKISGVKRILFYCNRDGLFVLPLIR